MVYCNAKSFSFHKRRDPKKSPKHQPEVPQKCFNNYVCPKCHQFYDFQLSNNAYVGRVPLLLKCKHTLCEECVLLASLKQRLECVECNTVTNIDTGSGRKKLQDILPVNFYVFGMVLYYRRAKVLKPNFSFQPILTEKAIESHNERCVTMKCCQNKCTNSADLKCLDCDEMFCEKCSEVVHKPGESGAQHDLIILRDFTPELKQSCSTHKGSVMEFACKPCDLKLCCYCVLSGHKDHEYYQLTQLRDEDADNIKTLLVDVENSLQYLKITDKKISSYLHQTSQASNVNVSNTNLSSEISRHFENFHAKLQAIETRLYDELEEHKQSRHKSLIAARERVHQNAVFLSKLYHCANQILKKEDVKYDVGFIIENLKMALKIRCHLIRQEVEEGLEIDYGNAINDIDDYYNFKGDKKSEFVLVTTKDIPEDCRMESFSSIDSRTSLSNSISLTNDYSIDDESTKASEKSFDEHSTTSSKKSDISIPRSTVSKKSVTSNSKESIEDQMSLNTKNLSSSCESLPELDSGDKHRVTVTHINSPESFYVHLSKSSSISLELSKVIGKYAMRSCMKVEPQIGEIYLVKFNDGSMTQWYRGRVTEINKPSNKYIIFFIDYGNTSVVSKNWIRNIPTQLINIPPLAIHCKIYDLFPQGSSWSRSAISLMADVVNKESLLMVVIDKSLDIYSVDLITLDGTTSLRDALIFTGEGLPLLNSNNLVAETKKEMAAFTVKKEIHQKNWKFVEKESYNVVITHVESPQEVYLILAETQRSFNNMKSEMQKFYKGVKKGLVYSMEIGMYVAVLYTSEFQPIPTWYRAKIIQVPESRGLIIVQLIDIGPKVSVQWENVRKLDDNFYTTNWLAFKVSLTDVQLLNDNITTRSNKIREFFSPFINNGIILEMIIWEDGDLPNVVLLDKREETKICINALAVTNDCGIASGKIGLDLTWKQEEKRNFTVEMMKTIQSIDSIHDESRDSEYPNGYQKEVEIVSIENPSLIYVRFLDYKIKHMDLHSEMQSCYGSCEFPPQKWSPKQHVAVKYDDQYYRGIVMEEISEDTYKVSLRDILKDVEVSSKNMMTLYRHFSRPPELITRCHLANIIPAGGSEKWSAMACEFLRETLKDKHSILLMKCGQIDFETRSLPVILWYKQYFPGGALEESKTVLCSVNKSLLKNGLALRANVKENNKQELIRNNSTDKKFWDWPPPNLITDDHLLAVPTCVNNSGHIYIHDVRDEQPLEEMSKNLLAYFKDSEVDNKLEDWNIGDICIAKYFLNDEWYRAKVVGINENSISVVMVDYGNEEDLQPSDLRKKVLYDNVPVLSTVVYLQDLNPLNGVWNKDDLDVLHAAIVDKEIDVYFIKGHDIRNPSPVYMSYKGINVNQFLLTKCQHLENSVSLNNGDSSSLESDGDPDVIIEDDKHEDDSKSEGDQKRIKLENKKHKQEEKESPSDLPITINFKIEVLPDENNLEIVIINLFEYNVIVFERTNYENINLELFERMEKDIQIQAETLKTLNNPKLSSPCIVKYSQDNSYYRCKIIGIRKDEFLVWFVDYGNFEFVPKSEVKEIKPEWLDYPVQHHMAEIDGIVLMDPSKKEAVKDHLASFYSTMVIADVTSRDPLKVRLLNPESRELIYQKFIDDGTLKCE